MSQGPAKRSRCSRYTLEQKLEAVSRVRDGNSKVSVARFFQIPESTLRGWCKAESKLRTQLMASYNGASRSSSESTSRRRGASTSTTGLRGHESGSNGPANSTTLDEHIALYQLRAMYITYVNHLVNNAIAVLRSNDS